MELNEAFAAQALACVDAWHAGGLVDTRIDNASGGAIAIGHPLGASGGRILGTWATVFVCPATGGASLPSASVLGKVGRGRREHRWGVAVARASG